MQELAIVCEHIGMENIENQVLVKLALTSLSDLNQSTNEPDFSPLPLIFIGDFKRFHGRECNCH